MILIENRLPSIYIISIPVILIVHFIFVTGLGMIFSIVGVFFKDINYVLPIIMQLLMLSTPVLYKKSDVPGAFQIITDYNPIYYLIDAYRNVLYMNTWPDWYGLLAPFLIGLILIIIGYKLNKFVNGILEAIL